MLVALDHIRLGKAIAEGARAMVDGNTSFLEGALTLQTLWATANFDLFDPDFVPITVIISETDHLPISPDVRKLWAPEALAKLQSKLENSEVWARRIATESCFRLIDRFGLSAIRRQIAETAHAMLNGDISAAEGAHRLVALRVEANLPDGDPDFLPFSEVSDRCDFLPLSDGRESWPLDALEKSFPQIVRIQEWAARTALPNCQRLIDRFGHTATSALD